MNTIDIGRATIDDSVIRSGTVEMALGLISERLDIDTFTFYAYSEYEMHPILLLADSTGKVFQTSEGKYITVNGDPSKDPTQFATTGQRLYLNYVDGEGNSTELWSFFVQSVECVGKFLYKFTCYTLIGLLAQNPHTGGLYTGDKTFSDVLDTLCRVSRGNSLTIYALDIDEDIDSEQPVYGYLPYGNEKDNLMHLLFSFGYILVPMGWRHYRVTTPSKYKNVINKSNQIIQPSISKLETASQVRLIEHSYFESSTDIEVTLFDNTGDGIEANDTTIVFKNPCHNLSTTGTLEILDSGVNYAKVSGTGTLVGFEYSHSRKMLTSGTEGTSGRTITIENETLVTQLNSKNVLERLVNLQNAVEEASIEFYPTLYPERYSFEQLGDEITFTDAFGKTRTGNLSSIKYELSHKPRFSAKALIGLKTGPFGQNINDYVEFTEIGNHYWTVPEGITEITVILGQAGTGGQGGMNGERGEDGTVGADEDETVGYSGKGGKGGEKGKGGTGGKVHQFTLAVNAGDSVWIFTDEGGAGGRRNGGLGSEGAETLCEINGVQYSSASGAAYPSGYYNPLNGVVYGGDGEDGIDGADGGSTYASPDGEYIFAGNTTKGSGGTNADEVYYQRSTLVYFQAYGGGGGGASFVSGYDGLEGELVGSSTIIGAIGGDGGDGGDGETPDQSPVGKGGRGADGGGGGGGGGGVQVYRSSHASNSSGGNGGLRGYAGYGGQGGNGWAVILF